MSGLVEGLTVQRFRATNLGRLEGLIEELFDSSDLGLDSANLGPTISISANTISDFELSLRNQIRSIKCCNGSVSFLGVTRQLLSTSDTRCLRSQPPRVVSFPQNRFQPSKLYVPKLHTPCAGGGDENHGVGGSGGGDRGDGDGNHASASSSSSSLPALFANCPPGHMFEPGAYTLMNRLGTFVYKGVVFAAVGFVASLVGTAISNGLIKLRKKMDPNFETPNKPPPTLLNALTWAAHMVLAAI
ncbi:Detected protein of unknown function [Hibiscus syriacus]|uniref:Uncharacterized protein n=1 Tax=Hibiscus syriacus TaxID=106335 RepID=A0A6A3B961_HIBSY|nr:Detected protein of unknown function [Hibiscus syriacus]